MLGSTDTLPRGDGVVVNIELGGSGASSSTKMEADAPEINGEDMSQKGPLANPCMLFRLSPLFPSLIRAPVAMRCLASCLSGRDGSWAGIPQTHCSFNESPIRAVLYCSVQYSTVRRMLAWLGQRRLPKVHLLLGTRARLRERKPIGSMGERGSPEHQLTA